MAEKRPTILQIIPELDTGGAELSTIEIADAVQSAGGRCIVLTEGGRLVQRLRDTGAEVQFFPAGAKMPFRLLWNAHRIANVIRRDGVDLVHARSRAPAWSALIAARRTGVPFVTTYHGAYSEKSDVKRLYNSVMARGDAVIANSHYTADLIRMRYGTPRAKLHVIYRGVDGRLFDPVNVAPERVNAVRSRWGIDDSKRVILHAARLTAWKGQKVVIEAAELLSRQRGPRRHGVHPRRRRAGARRLPVGTGQRRSMRPGSRSACASSATRTTWRPPSALAHVAVVASVEPEAFGRAATEAQVMATPVIATDIGAPPETVLGRPGVSMHRATGWLVPPADPQRLAEALTEALAMTADEHARMGARARTHVLNAFSLKQMKQQTLQVYDALLGTHLAEPT